MLLKIRRKHLKSLEHLITKECQKNLTSTGYIECKKGKENSENILRHIMRKNGLENLILKGRIALTEGLADKKKSSKLFYEFVRPKRDDKYSEGQGRCGE